MTSTDERTKPTGRPKSNQQRLPASRDGGVDPKLAARRVEVARHEGRRRLRLLAALCIVTLLALGCIVAANSSFLDVDEVEVIGAANTDPAAVVAAGGVVIGDPLLDLDVEAAVSAMERLPWIESATIDRTVGGSVLITVSERVPVSGLPLDAGLMLVDRDGRQLGVVAGAPTGFLPIIGITPDGVVGQPAPPETHAVLRLLAKLTPAITPEVTQVEWANGTLVLHLRAGGRVKLGDDTALEEKMVSLETILAKVDLRCLSEIDVRVPSAPAVTRLNAGGDPRAAVVDLAECT